MPCVHGSVLATARSRALVAGFRFTLKYLVALGRPVVPFGGVGCRITLVGGGGIRSLANIFFVDFRCIIRVGTAELAP